MYGKHLSGHTSLVLRPIKALLLLLFPAFEELHDNIKFVTIGCTQRKLFKENDRQGEREQTIATQLLKMPIDAIICLQSITHAYVRSYACKDLHGHMHERLC